MEASDASHAVGKIEVLEERWPDGTLRRTREVKRDAEGNPVSHGATTAYTEDGHKRSEIHFVDGVKHGPRRTWFGSGKDWSYGEYDHGLPCGTWTTLNSQGTMVQQWQYDDKGGYHGPFRLWHENGQLRMEFEFVHGVKQGFETLWDQDGAIRFEVDYGRVDP